MTDSWLGGGNLPESQHSCFRGGAGNQAPPPQGPARMTESNGWNAKGQRAVWPFGISGGVGFTPELLAFWASEWSHRGILLVAGRPQKFHVIRYPRRINRHPLDTVARYGALDQGEFAQGLGLTRILRIDPA